MVEEKPLKRIMAEYKSLLEKYEDRIGNFEKAGFKRLIGEVRLFWYRHQKYVQYFLSNIESEDEVAYLAGAVRLDIVNDGHIDYALVGKYRIINDPLLKLSTFYKGTEEEINFEYVNGYLKDCFSDLLILFREYFGDFYLLPFETVSVTDNDEYYSALANASEKMVLSLFSKEYSRSKDMFEDNSSFEDIEEKFLPGIGERLIFDSVSDAELSLREKYASYLRANGDIMPIMNKFSEPQKFFMMVNQYCMQAIAIANVMINYNMIPFIRNDVTFRYFNLVFYSSIMEEFTKNDFLKVYVPYILQKAIDFSDKGYQAMKDKIGNGKMIEYIISAMNEKKDIRAVPLPKAIIQYADEYLGNI